MGGCLVQWRFGPEFWEDRPPGRTGPDGTYRIPIPKLGLADTVAEVYVRASSTGSFPQNKAVAVAGETALNFELKPAPASNGTVTLSAVRSQQPQCDFYTSRVGRTEPLWLTMESTGESVRLTLSANGPSEVGPDGYPLSFFVGSRRGDVVEAEYKGPLSQLFCSANDNFAREVGGTLIATISGNEISGEYTSLYRGWIARSHLRIPIQRQAVALFQRQEPAQILPCPRPRSLRSDVRRGMQPCQQ